MPPQVVPRKLHGNDWLGHIGRRGVAYFYLAVTSRLVIFPAILNNINNTSTASAKQIKLGVILPYTGRHPWVLDKTRPALEYAVETIKNTSLLRGYDVILNFNDSKCSDFHGPLSAFEMFNHKKADVFIGPACDYAVAPIARYSVAWGIPVLSAGALVDAFRDKKEFPLLTRLLGAYVQVGSAFISLCEHFGWSHVGLIYSDFNESGRGRSRCFFAMQPIYKSIKSKFGYEPWHSSFDENLKDRDMEKALKGILTAARTNARVVVVSIKHRYLDVFMRMVHEMGMDGGDYAFIVIDLFLGKDEIHKPWLSAQKRRKNNKNNNNNNNNNNNKSKMNDNENDGEVEGTAADDVKKKKETKRKKKQPYDAILLLTLTRPESESYYAFSRELKRRAKLNATDEEVSSFVVAFHDGVLLYAQALNETLTAGGNISDGIAITRRMWNRTFQGISGVVRMDANGDRHADYSLYDLDPDNEEFKVVSVFTGVDKKFRHFQGPQGHQGHQSVHWPGPHPGHPPSDVPACGFHGERCPPDEPIPIYVIVTIVLACSLVLVLAATFVVWRHYRLEAELAEMNWRVRYEDIVFGHNDRYRSDPRSHGRDVRRCSASSNESEVKSHKGVLLRVKVGNKRRGSLPSNTSIDSVGAFINKGRLQLFTKTGYVKGTLAAIKPIQKTSLTITKPILLEIKKMKGIHNDHIVRFVGLCIDTPNASILTDYCQRGSLQDVLENEEINLDWMFRYSIIQDVVRGMASLHCSEIRCHGNLKSSNCVIDSRFVVKITDFGLSYFREKVDELGNNEYACYRNRLWTAPELLRMLNRPPEGSQKGDVYSFGIICQEVVYRFGVFYIPNCDFTPKEICLRVMKPQNKIYFRPTIESRDCPDADLADVIRKCWAEEPGERPDFSTLRSVIRKLNKEGDKPRGNILDNLLTRMEQYANNLEAVVAERTSDYLEQKRRAEDLLYSMLPKSVAEQLIQGEAVKAESFDSVSIFFSDIVGFTAMSAVSSPMQVVSLLNDLYTTFDSILEHYDVYKVETIGDAYMVASGLPLRNGNAHAPEIARMSLALLGAVQSFKIRHRPNENVKLRIGIHSGSVCAGVVGLKMPRYCLFGDTVNTASRMEAHGQPLKIHVSPDTKKVLDLYGTFVLELRGAVEMKGKGTITTYWLLQENKTTPRD